MTERIAISAGSLRMVCTALLMLLIVRVDFFANAVEWQMRSEVVGSAIRCTQPVLRTHQRMRTLGLHQRYMMRDDVGRRRMHRLDQ